MKGSNQGFGFNATILADQDPVEGSPIELFASDVELATETL